MRRPKTTTEPRLGFKIPAAHKSSVDFPASGGPTTPSISPAQTSRSMLESAGAVPNDFDNDLIDKIGYDIPDDHQWPAMSRDQIIARRILFT
jgi:hypothetical protein